MDDFKVGLYIDLKMSKNPANIYLFKVNNKKNRKRYEVCSKLTIKTSKRSH